MHYLLFYDAAADYAERRAPLRQEHLALARAAHERGELVLGGAFADPIDGAVLLFRGESPAVAESFARADPYVRHGLVKRWWVRAWATVVGDGVEVPIDAQPSIAHAHSIGPSRTAIDAATLERLSRLSPEEVEKIYAGTTPPEAVVMLLAIMRGSMVGPGEGWFGPGQSQYSWEWLAKRHGISAPGTISAENFSGPQELFSRLDRNCDGQIDADDLDWSSRNPWVHQGYLMHRLFRRINPHGSGRVMQAEWQAFFDEAKNGKDYLTAEDLRDALLRGTSGGMIPGDMPSKEILLHGLLTGEVGSFHEGPRIGDRAPDFSLQTHDGARTIRLADAIGKQPVVLVFGNFTCPPFRALYQGVDEVLKHFQHQAVFLAVYVREVHPTDGWHMVSNDRVGVKAAQPKTYDQRARVATCCHELIKPSMPLLVDEISDPVGSAYSGMPARLYVIDREGKIAYKCGRGPFGFKAGEMEQALIMTLLDQSPSISPVA